jgi:adenylate kinase
MPPKLPDRCDRCDGVLGLRNDDKIPSIKKRLAVYKAQTAPLIKYYKRSSLLKEIDGAGTPGEIVVRAMDSLAS